MNNKKQKNFQSKKYENLINKLPDEIIENLAKEELQKQKKQQKLVENLLRLKYLMANNYISKAIH